MLSQYMYTVKDLCRIANVSRKTLFYYDRIGLLCPEERIGKQKSRRYGEADLKRLYQIRFYQRAGLTLSEIRTVLDHPGEDHTDLFLLVSRRLQKKMNDIAEMLERAQKLKEETGNDPFEMPVLRDDAGSR